MLKIVQILSLYIAITLTSVSTNAFEARILKVGSHEKFKKPSEAAKVAQDGDIIEINAETYHCDGGVKWLANDLIIRGVNGRPIISWQSCTKSIPGNKGLWVPTGTNFTVDNIEFSHAQVSDHNGAGIRFSGGGKLTISNSYFHHNQNGILVTPNTKKYPIDMNEVHIDSSEFAYNGYKDGRSHNMYITKTQVFSIQNSYSHHADTGHLIKSIARENYIYNNKLTDGVDGSSSYNIDISGGGITYVVGNIIQQSNNSQNSAMIAYAAEAKKSTRNNPNKTLYITNNTFINELSKGVILRVFDYHDDFSKGLFANNLMSGMPTKKQIQHKNKRTKGLIQTSNNLFVEQSDFQDYPHFNYHLNKNSAAINSATIFSQQSLVPRFEFSSNFQRKERTKDNKLDIGAYEYDGSTYPLPKLTVIYDEKNITYNQNVTLLWESVHTDSCIITGDIEKKITLNGRITIDSITENHLLNISCTGEGGGISQRIRVNVTENPKAKLLPNIKVSTIANTKINDTLDIKNPLINGVKKYWPINSISSVYSDDLNKVFIQGGGQRNYYGNELFEFNAATNILRNISKRTDVTSLKKYLSTDKTFWDLFSYKRGCSGIWRLTNDDIKPAARNLKKSLVYINSNSSLFLQGGMVACSSNKETSDGWEFNVLNKKWRLIHAEMPKFKGTTARYINYDKTSRLVIINHNKGTFLYDPISKKVGLKNAGIPYINNASQLIDESANMLVTIGGKQFSTIDISNLSLSSKLVVKNDWVIVGAKSILESDYISTTYNDNTKKIVAWNGNGTLYFFELNHDNSTVEIIAKKINGFETKLGKDIIYMRKLGAYLNIVDSRFNFNLFTESTPSK